MEQPGHPEAQSPDESDGAAEKAEQVATFNDTRARALAEVIKTSVEAVDEYGEEGALRELLVEVIGSISPETLCVITQLPDGKNKQSPASDRSELRELAKAELERRGEGS